MKKRVLILIDDLMMSNFYRDKLESSGLAVEVAMKSAEALEKTKKSPADLVLVDPVLSGMNGLEIIRSLRELAPKAPILVVSHLPRTLSTACRNAGATKVIPPDGLPLDKVFEEVGTLFGIKVNTQSLYSENSDEFWISSAINSTNEAVKTMRLTAYSFAKTRSNPNLLYSLFCELHHASERMAAVGLSALNKITSAIATLVYDLFEMPEQINDSSVRTAVQSVDFFGTLLDRNNLVRLSDPSAGAVLAVDDEPDALATIAGALRMVGINTSVAPNANDALSLLRDVDFKLIFLDIGLPGTNGFDLCKQTREIPNHQKTPIVFITGMTTFQNRALSTLSGGNDFIGKPFNLHELGVKALTWIFKGQLGMM